MTNQLLEARDRFAGKYPEQRMTLNGRTWSVIDVGERGPALLMLPGTLGRADIFWQQIEALADRARIISVSYPATHDIDLWANDLVRLLDRLQIDSATVMGSSLGGYLAQYFAARFGDRITNLVAANTLCSVNLIKQVPPYSSDIAKTPIQELRNGFLKAMKINAGDVRNRRELISMLIAEVNGRIPAKHLRARLLALKHAPAIPQNSLPQSRVSVIESANDPLIPIQLRDGVRNALLPAVTYRFLRGGHFPYVLRPKAYLSILEQVLGVARTGSDWGTGKVREL